MGGGGGGGGGGGEYSTVGCQSIFNNDVPCSWNVRYLYYFNELTLLGRINEVDRA